mmetsp:Transcript_27298/g.33305  ORF Transcript_27298/g.33305 Transcript_27298/m.33305 type:complete len:101 (+) Transcript_27298:280-582(+)
MSTAKEEAIDLSWTLGPPTFDVLEPGNCQFDENWKKVELVERTKIAHNVIVFTFRTPDGKTSLNLPTCQLYNKRAIYIYMFLLQWELYLFVLTVQKYVYL